MRIVIDNLQDYFTDVYFDGHVMEVDKHGQYKVGEVYQTIGEIITIFEHPESDCVWLLIKDWHGNLFEVDIEWAK